MDGEEEGSDAAKEIESESRKDTSGGVGGWRKGWVAGTLDSSPHRHADLNGGLAPSGRH